MRQCGQGPLGAASTARATGDSHVCPATPAPGPITNDSPETFGWPRRYAVQERLIIRDFIGSLGSRVCGAGAAKAQHIW